MDKENKRNLIFSITAMAIMGVSAGWYFSKQSTITSPQGMLGKVTDEAKEKAMALNMRTTSMSITDIEEGRIKVSNGVVMSNPMPITLNASRLDYVVLMNSVKVAEGSYQKRIKLPAGGSTNITMPMEIMVKPFDTVTDKVDQQGKDSATYTFINTIYTTVPIAGKRKLNVEFSEQLPIVRLPKVKPGKIDVDKLGLKNSSMDMVIHVTNPNSFPIKMQDGQFTMIVDGDMTMEGTMEEVVSLPAKGTEPVTMHMDIKTGKAGKLGWKMLFDKKDTRYEIKFKSKIISNERLLKNSNMSFREEGTLYDLKQELKKELKEK